MQCAQVDVRRRTGVCIEIGAASPEGVGQPVGARAASLVVCQIKWGQSDVMAEAGVRGKVPVSHT